MPVLGVIFLRHATNRYDTARQQIAQDQAAGKMKRPLVKQDFIKRRALMLPKQARYDELLKLPKGTNLGALVEAMNDRARFRAAAKPASQGLREIRERHPRALAADL